MNCMDNCLALAQGFAKERELLWALGEQTRQQVFLVLLEQEDQNGGLRVGEIAQRAHLSRPAVSHHLRILRQTGIVRLRKMGTKSYYSMNAETEIWDELHALLGRVCAVVHRAQEKGAEKWM
ncbi:MAG: ArsR/SmtB family transcription factor [Agathobaculum sp.]|jgi:DNA-binding transcriptional ArsR family regulator|uniref:ArsR/SmtB family transcription factor n=1 Tax=Agathobaculum sp. TaxID=2048138 RepID=UPI003D917929